MADLMHRSAVFTCLLLLLSCVTVCKAVDPSEIDKQCNQVHQHTGQESCDWVVNHCEAEGLIPYLSIYYCSLMTSPKVVRVLVQLAFVALLVLLFRVLGSTAEEFFSPTLTQISQELGLPPRLAGVTFLALGNGAPDLSSAVAAVGSGNYPLALGAQIGSGTFVGCVVAGAVLIVGETALKAKGAFLRDVSAYALTLIMVTIFFSIGKFFLWSAILLLVLYALYVLVVLCADFWHRRPKSWRRGDVQTVPLLSQSTPGSPRRSWDGSNHGAPHRVPASAPPTVLLEAADLGLEDEGEGNLFGHYSRQSVMAMPAREYSFRAHAELADEPSLHLTATQLRSIAGHPRRSAPVALFESMRDAETGHGAVGGGGRYVPVPLEDVQDNVLSPTDRSQHSTASWQSATSALARSIASITEGHTDKNTRDVQMLPLSQTFRGGAPGAAASGTSGGLGGRRSVYQPMDTINSERGSEEPEGGSPSRKLPTAGAPAPPPGSRPATTSRTAAEQQHSMLDDHEESHLLGRVHDPQQRTLTWLQREGGAADGPEAETVSVFETSVSDTVEGKQPYGNGTGALYPSWRLEIEPSRGYQRASTMGPLSQPSGANIHGRAGPLEGPSGAPSKNTGPLQNIRRQVHQAATGERSPLPFLMERVWPVVSKGFDFGYTILEWPLLVARKATIPLVQADVYSRRWLLVSLLLAPLVLVMNFGLFTWPWLVGSVLLGATASAAAWWGTRGTVEPPLWCMGTSFPIGAGLVALFGFVVAALWINRVANELVALLEFLGVLWRIDPTLLGLTVLAWGNSMGDLATNVAMAKRGMSSMAITACFAGPVFNMLIGLGAGFIIYFQNGQRHWIKVSLPPLVIPGICVILVNCSALVCLALWRQSIPRRYGWGMVTLYCGYLVVAVVMSFVVS